MGGQARRGHFDFVSKLRDRGVEVVELHDLLTETMAIPEAKAWLLDRKIVANEVGLGSVDGQVGRLRLLSGRGHADRGRYRCRRTDRAAER